jgi:hypothetical protein
MEQAVRSSAIHPGEVLQIEEGLAEDRLPEKGPAL